MWYSGSAWISHKFLIFELQYLPCSPMYQVNVDGDTVSVFKFSNPFLAGSTENKQFAELGASTLQQCLGHNCVSLWRKRFSTIIDEIPSCLASLFYIYDIPSIHNCTVEFVIVPDTSQAFYRADALYHVFPYIQNF